MTEGVPSPPCVSVIITVFRRVNFLADAIGSVLRQDFSDFEIIVSDDSDCSDIRQIVAMFDDGCIRYNPSVRRDAISPALFDDAVSGAYDYWLACVLAATGRPLYYTPLRLTRYRVHDRMETQRRDPLKGEDELLILRKILDASWFGEITDALDARFAEVAFGAALNKLRFGLRRQARLLTVAGLRKSFRLKGLVIYLATFAPMRLFAKA